MILNSTVFIFIFLPLSLAFYYMVPVKLRYIVLFILSLMFLFLASPRFFPLFILSMTVNYLSSLLTGRLKGKRVGVAVFVFGVLFNISVLFVFKYLGFFTETFNGILGTSFFAEKLAAPLGISFYTFQAISLLADVRKGTVKSPENPIKVFLYLIMFPQLASGPIMRFSEVEEDMSGKNVKLELMTEGAERFIAGLFKKTVLADSLYPIWLSAKDYDIYSLSFLHSWVGIAAFTLYIYLDFSGYMDMAIGCANLFGYRLTENFRYPYLSQSVAEFWRRWHITLGRWFRDYIYIPMGGSKRGTVRFLTATMTVWLVTGLWHGASWNFIVWGLYFAVVIILEKYLIRKYEDRIPKFLRITATLLIVIAGWVFFATDGMMNALYYLGVMTGQGEILFDRAGLEALRENAGFFILSVFSVTPVLKNIAVRKDGPGDISETLFRIAFFVSLFLVSLVFLIKGNYSPSMYTGF